MRRSKIDWDKKIEAVDVCDLVKEWYSGCAANNGILLIGNEEINSLVGFL